MNVRTMIDNIGKQVKIIPLDNSKGRVLSVWTDGGDYQYNVRYYVNGEAKSCYFIPEELEFVGK